MTKNKNANNADTMATIANGKREPEALPAFLAILGFMITILLHRIELSIHMEIPRPEAQDDKQRPADIESAAMESA